MTKKQNDVTVNNPLMKKAVSVETFVFLDYFLLFLVR